MTEALILSLAKIQGIRVISRTSVMRYKGSGRPVREIAAELNVDAVLEGSVRRTGERVSVTAQLVQVSSDSRLWGETYERAASDVIAVQDDIAQAIARRIHAELTPHERPSNRQPVKVDRQCTRRERRGPTIQPRTSCSAS